MHSLRFARVYATSRGFDRRPSRTRRGLLAGSWNWVDRTHGTGIRTGPKSLDAQREALADAVFLHGINGVLGTGWSVAAANTPFEQRPPQGLIDMNGAYIELAGNLVCRVSIGVRDGE